MESDILLQFVAPWCSPCRAFSPIVASVTSELGLSLRRVDVTEEPEMAERFAVTGVPTIVLVRGDDLVPSAEVDRHVGPMNGSSLAAWLDTARA